MARSSLALCVVATLGLGCDHSSDVVASLATTQASEPVPDPKPTAGTTSEPIAGAMGPLAGAAPPTAGVGGAGAKAPTASPPSAGSSAPQAGSAAMNDPCDRLWNELTFLTLATTVNKDCRFTIGQESAAVGSFFQAVPLGSPQPETTGPTECGQAQITTPWYREDDRTWRLCDNACNLLKVFVASETATRLMCKERADSSS